MVRFESSWLDPVTAKQGRWVPYPHAPGIELKIARLNAVAYTATLVALRREQEGDGRDDDRRAVELLAAASAEHLLLDWRNVTDEDDKPVPYSREAAIRYLSDPGAILLREFLSAEAQRNENFRIEREAKSLGNSASVCAGNSSSDATD